MYFHFHVGSNVGGKPAYSKSSQFPSSTVYYLYWDPSGKWNIGQTLGSTTKHMYWSNSVTTPVDDDARCTLLLLPDDLVLLVVGVVDLISLNSPLLLLFSLVTTLLLLINIGDVFSFTFTLKMKYKRTS